MLGSAQPVPSLLCVPLGSSEANGDAPCLDVLGPVESLSTESGESQITVSHLQLPLRGQREKEKSVARHCLK